MVRQTFFAAVIAFSVAAAACGSGSAASPASNTEKALKDAHLNDVKVDWDSDARIAHLRGTVDSPADRERAEQVASSTVGTSGRVLNEVTIKGINADTAGDLDGQIKSALKRMVNNDPILKDRDINFEVHNGVATVKGDVRSVAEKTKVSEIVRSAPGVKDFANALEIRPEK
jgi:osmotically-inducible protein OsmY